MAKHHFVPQLYLREWLDPDSLGKDDVEPYLWVYEKGTLEPFPKAPKNVAFRGNLYSANAGQDFDEDAVEKIFQKIESEYATVWRRKIKQRQPLSAEDRGVVAAFVSALFPRSPFMRDHLGSFMEEIARDVAGMITSSEEHLKILGKQYEERTGQSIAGLEAEVFDPSNFEFESTRETKTAFMLTLFKDIFPFISRMPWVFVEAPEGEFLLTCDMPVSLTAPRRRGPVGFGSPDAEIAFPLSPKVCLIASWIKKVDRCVMAPKGFVEQVNLRVQDNAEKEVYSSRKDPSISVPL